jgi:N-acetylneuraminic acid mutarotase
MNSSIGSKPATNRRARVYIEGTRDQMIHPVRLWLVALLLTGCPPARPAHDAGNGPGTWTEVRPLDQERFEAAAAVLAGKIYIVGGISDLCPDGASACTLDRVDVYDPQAGTWSPAPPLPAGAPRHHLALAVVGGAIFVVGGFDGILGTANTFTPSASTWALDGATWTRRADAPRARGAATAQAIGGKIYVAGGGVTEPSALDELAVYDPAIDQWSTLTSMPTAREHVASCVVNGSLMVMGGWGGDKAVSSTVEAYDPLNDRWTALPSLGTARGGLGAAVLDGTCYAVGGEDWDGPAPGTFSDVQGVSSLDAAWQDFAPLPHARHGIGVAEVAGALYVIGGGPSRGNSYTNEVDQFRP